MGAEYTIEGGLTDARRLARQARVMGEATEAFLNRVGVAPGWACLDVGCGDGQVSVLLAQLSSPGGRVVGLDVDGEALALARGAAERADVDVELVEDDIEAVAHVSGSFDLAYARLLLSHLVDPASAVRAMVARLRPGGVVAVEDLYLGTLRSEPPAPALDRLQDVYGATVRYHGGDPTIGPRLPALLAASGLVDVEEHVVTNPMTTVDEKVFLAELVRNMRASILEAGAATADEIDELATDVEEAARDEGNVFFQADIHQVSGHRSSDG